MVFAEKTYNQIKEYLDGISQDQQLEEILTQLSLDKRATVLRLVSKYQQLLIKRQQEQNRLLKLWKIERSFLEKDYLLIAGVDEAGRGPLAGPVVAAAVILPPYTLIPGLNDSKKLTEEKRKTIAREIKCIARAWAVGVVDAPTIDNINILEATRYAMDLALKSLKIRPQVVLMDGPKQPNIKLPQEGIINGDSLSASIAAASILAKVHRDNIMDCYSELFPQYFFDKHKGYGTANHLEALETYGPSPIHRYSFGPVAKIRITNSHD